MIMGSVLAGGGARRRAPIVIMGLLWSGQQQSHDHEANDHELGLGCVPGGGWLAGDLVVPYLCRERDTLKKFNYVQ
jgi:hypothetical protein